MQLKPEALNALKLPVKVKVGFLGSVKLKVLWSRLGQDPVLVYLDRIFLLAEPATSVEGCSEDAIQEAKKSRVQCLLHMFLLDEICFLIRDYSASSDRSGRGSNQANTRTTKFAPKLKPTSKPKLEPSSKQEPQDSAPKPQPPPVEAVSKKKENDKDFKPPMVAEPKVEQSISNGAVKMEIDEETKEDEILTEANREDQGEEEDMVVREIDVFFTPSIDADAQDWFWQLWKSGSISKQCRWETICYSDLKDQIFPLNFMGLLPCRSARCHMLNAMEDISLAHGLVNWVTVMLLLRREAEMVHQI
ncbi:hypothetical protein J1N35_022941 [Gossypium stocksii]|uniref:Chorein N-terminal domain-containing protein n=1 Tax=Gossypium stocksii TaxID=47602 RepID=A0A9D3VGY8_9ROSI|nr:hypothetical protein J1N35_022941 [Gossypium stocksii]